MGLIKKFKNADGSTTHGLAWWWNLITIVVGAIIGYITNGAV